MEKTIQHLLVITTRSSDPSSSTTNCKYFDSTNNAIKTTRYADIFYYEDVMQALNYGWKLLGPPVHTYKNLKDEYDWYLGLQFALVR